VTASTAVFIVLAAIAVVSGLNVILRRNPVHSAIFLAFTILTLAGIFVLLNAEFIAATEVIIYAGAIIVLFVFVVMMLNLGERAVEMESKWLTPGMWVGPEILAAILIAEVVYLLSRPVVEAHAVQFIEPRDVGAALFGPYLIGVELASMLLLGALVGAYHLGYRKPKALEHPDADNTDATRTAAGGDSVRPGHDRIAGAA
jgi:NADH-quinone oxidoreductase subunit J